MNPTTHWAREKATEIIQRNSLTTTCVDWIIYNNLAGVTAMGEAATANLVAAFDEAGYEMRQTGQVWEIRLKSRK